MIRKRFRFSTIRQKSSDVIEYESTEKLASNLPLKWQATYKLDIEETSQNKYAVELGCVDVAYTFNKETFPADAMVFPGSSILSKSVTSVDEDVIQTLLDEYVDKNEEEFIQYFLYEYFYTDSREKYTPEEHEAVVAYINDASYVNIQRMLAGQDVEDNRTYNGYVEQLRSVWSKYALTIDITAYRGYHDLSEFAHIHGIRVEHLKEGNTFKSNAASSYSISKNAATGFIEKYAGVLVTTYMPKGTPIAVGDWSEREIIVAPKVTMQVISVSYHPGEIIPWHVEAQVTDTTK
jgi:hypothetical protein